MHRGLRWTWAIALGFALGLAALAQADEDDVKPAKTGNWFTRLFVKDPAAKKKQTDAKKEEAPAPSPSVLRQQAQWEWIRRQEVCDKLRQIGLESGDKELSRKA